MSQHVDQVASVLHREIQALLSRGLNDPRVRGLISVTEVKVSPDLADATVRVSIIPEDAAELSMHGLKSASAHIRHQLAKQVRMRRTPRLQFVLDQSLKKQSEVLGAINRAGRRERGGEAAGEDAQT